MYISIPKAGELEEKILKYLALNPDKNVREIQEGIGYGGPNWRSNYAAVLNAVKNLKKKHLLISKEGRSEKKVRINLYKLSTKGVGYVRFHGLEPDLLKIAKAYEDTAAIKVIEKLKKRYGPELFQKIEKITSQVFALNLHAKPENSFALAFLVLSSLNSLSEEELRIMAEDDLLGIGLKLKKEMVQKIKKFIES